MNKATVAIYTAIYVIAFCLLAACNNANTPKTTLTETTTDPTKIISEAYIDYDRNGDVEKLYVRMVTEHSIEKKESNAPWEGEFRLELIGKDGVTIHALDLNPSFGGGSLTFAQNRSFDIAFEDYNNDGYPDFSIGQYFSSNGSTYNLYSLMPEGIAVIHQDLFTADSNYSVLYEKAGNTAFKNRYYDMEKGAYVDTLYTWQGDGFVRTECEGCELTADVSLDDTFGDLQLIMKKTEDGFRLAHTDQNNFYINQTLVSPGAEGASYAVHIVRTDSSNEEMKYRRVAVVVNPETAEFQVFPLYSVEIEDAYNVDSVAVAYGFLDDRHLVYVSVVNDDKRTAGNFLRLEKLNIISGEKTILIPEIPDMPMDDHYAPGWMNDKKDTLVLNSYSTGQLWSFDLIKGDVTQLKSSFNHSWPFYLTVKSPDGERFWYSDYDKKEFRLHDKKGLLLSNMKTSKGYDQYPAFIWSSDSQYAAYQDTRDQSDAHIIGDNGEVNIIAPQRIQFFDRQGKLIRTVQTGKGPGKYIEVSGWLDRKDGLVLLHEYELERKLESETSKINSSYSLLDINSGESHNLQINSDSMHFEGSVPARMSLISIGADRRIFWVDTKKMRLTVVAENGEWITGSNKKQDAWVTSDEISGITEFHEFDSDNEKYRKKGLGLYVKDVVPIGTEWLVWSDMNYTRLD